MKIVLTGGAFDIVHPGHLFTLEKAASFGDLLIVVVASDAIIRKSKGANPIFNEEHRTELIKKLKPVDGAIIGSEKEPLKSFEKVMPNIVVFGYDQKQPVKLLQKIEKKYPKTKIIKLDNYLKREKYKTSKIRKELASIDEKSKRRRSTDATYKYF